MYHHMQDWQIQEYEAHAEAYEKELLNLPRRTMVRRPLYVKHPQLKKIQDQQEKLELSMTCMILDELSEFSGEGDERGYLLGLYYEPKKENKIISMLKKNCGVDITKDMDGNPVQSEPVDPESPHEHEQTIMYMPNACFYLDMMQYEFVTDEEYSKPWEEIAKSRSKQQDKGIADKPAENNLPVALLFPGQGSQYVKMLEGVKDLPKVKEMLDEAKGILGYDILDICLNGPEDKLEETRYCQPAMYIAGLAAMAKLEESEPEKVAKCQCVAGLSLGEYTALCAAGVFSFAEGLKLVKIRAEAMHEAAQQGSPHGMLSVAGVEASTIKQLVEKSKSTDETVAIANFLFPKGFAIAGTKTALTKLEPLLKEAGAIQAKMLKTSGAFHTSLMKGAQEKLQKALDDAVPRMQTPRCTVYSNVTGKPMPPGTDPKTIAKGLADQLCQTVLWEPSMRAMMKDNVQEYFELGPNKQLKAMLKRIDADAWAATTNVTV